MQAAELDGVEAAQAGPTQVLSGDAAGVAVAARMLRAGRLVAFPTETVYGLGADLRISGAVEAVYEAKRRPRDNPLIVHVEDFEAGGRLVVFSDLAVKLAEAFWPGPLTLVLPWRDRKLAGAAAAGQTTLAVRVPAHPVALELLRAVGGPLVGPSANLAGRVSPTERGHVLSDLAGRIDAVLDAGACGIGLESTIVGFSDEGARLLRKGAIGVAAIEACLERPLAQAPVPGQPQTPGGYASHYAPRAAVRLDAAAPGKGEAWLGFGPESADCMGGALFVNLSRDGDLEEAGRHLYGCLRSLDAALGGNGRIAVASIPETGMGVTINDRLRRAAVPRQG